MLRDVIVADSGIPLISRVDTTAQFEFDNQTPLSMDPPLDAPAAVAVVPEPTWLLTQGAALLALGMVARRRAARPPRSRSGKESDEA